jgi:hypothetical protein
MKLLKEDKYPDYAKPVLNPLACVCNESWRQKLLRPAVTYTQADTHTFISADQDHDGQKLLENICVYDRLICGRFPSLFSLRHV